LYSVYRWAYLDVKTSSSYTDEQQAFAAGMAEASHSSDLIHSHWMNKVQGYCTIPLSTYCTSLHKFLQTNLNWMNQQIKAYSNISGYWHMVSVYYRFVFWCWLSLLAIFQLYRYFQSYWRNKDVDIWNSHHQVRSNSRLESQII